MPALPLENNLPIVNLGEPGVILAIDDESDDVELLRLTLAQGNFPCRLISVPFARDAINSNRRESESRLGKRFSAGRVAVRLSMARKTNKSSNRHSDCSTD